MRYETRVSNTTHSWLLSLGGGADLCVHRKLLRPSLFVVSPQTMVMSVDNWSSFVPPLFVTRGFSSFLPKFDGTVYAGRIATTKCLRSDISALLLCISLSSAYVRAVYASLPARAFPFALSVFLCSRW